MKVCGKKDIHVPECSDCSELEGRVDAVEECCADAHEEIDTLEEGKAGKDYVDEQLGLVNSEIISVSDTLNERIDNIISVSEPSIRTLWEGTLSDNGDSVHLNDDVNNYEFLDVYYQTAEDEGEGHYGFVRIPSEQFANYIITVGGTSSPFTESPTLVQYLTRLSFVDDDATIDGIRSWSWSGSHSDDAVEDSQPEAGIIIYRIDGGLVSGGNAEIADAREGVDGTVYPSLGDAIREQIQETRDMIHPCPVQDVQVNGTSVVDEDGIAKILMPELTKTVQGNPITIDDAFGEVKSLEVGITPIQDLHGYDKPWAAGAGKNKFDKTATDTDKGYIAGKYLQYNGATATPSSSLVWNISEYIKVSPSTTYTLSGLPTTSSSSPSFCLYDADKQVLTGVQYGNQATRRIDTSATTEYIRISIPQAQIDGIQLELGSTATTYEPYSNICPITGRNSISVVDSGVNQYEALEGTYNGITWETLSDGTSEITGTATATTWTYLADVVQLPWRGISAGDKVTVYCDNARLSLQYAIGGGAWTSIANAVNGSVSVTIPATATQLRFLQYVENVSTTAGTTFNKIAKYYFIKGETFTSWTPYKPPITTTVTLPSTTYGADVDVTGGAGSNLMGIVDLSTPTWSASSSATADGSTCYYAKISDMKTDVANTGMVADRYALASGIYISTMQNGTMIRGNGYVYVATVDSTIAGQLVYPLATPTDLQTTPTDITLYNGDNVISSDGNITMEYVRDIAIVIQKIENQL